jgi:hypothetical protein
MKAMSFRKLLPLLAVVGFVFASSARAQFGVYGMVTGQRFGGIACPSFAAPCASAGGHAQDYGGSFGLLYDFHSFGPVRLGADLRGEVLTSNKRGDSSAGGVGIFRQYAAMGGARASVATPINWLRPYAEILVGYTHNNASGVYTLNTTVNNTVNPPTQLTSINYNPSVYADQPLFKGAIGADVRLAPFLDLRAIELGLGEAFGSSNTVLNTTTVTSASGTSTTTTVSASSPSTHGIASISAGLVLHF